MKMLLPVLTADDVRRLKQYAPDAEFYAGMMLSKWHDIFGPNAELNRMSAFGKEANLQGLSALEAIGEAAAPNDLFLTLNAPSYSKKQMEFLDALLPEIKRCRVTGIIIGDPLLADVVRKHGLKAVASTIIGIYNEDIAEWCRNLGFQRLILPRDLTLHEIREITQAVPDVEYECFLMRNGCRYSDSHCLARHRNQYGALCGFLDRAKVSFAGLPAQSFRAHSEALFNHHVFSRAFHKSACGMCALWRISRMNITAVKVVGRADGIQSVEEDVKILADNIKIALASPTEEAFLSDMVFPLHYDTICYQGMNCYYPEIRYGERNETE